jgi:hypothetical protein
VSVRDEENSFKTLNAGQLISSSEDSSSDADDEDGGDDGDAKDNRVTFENEDLLVKSKSQANQLSRFSSLLFSVRLSVLSLPSSFIILSLFLIFLSYYSQSQW